MQPFTRPAISSSVSGVSTTNGYSTRQSVASVTCDTRDMPSNLMLSLRGVAAQHARRARAQFGRLAEGRVEAAHRGSRPRAARPPARRAAGRPRRRGACRSRPGGGAAPRPAGAALRVVQQVVLQVGIALHHPDVAQHLVQHARRAAGAALLAQAVEHLPGARAEQADHDLAVGERGVVVGDLAQARRASRPTAGHELFECRWRVHRCGHVSQRMQPAEGRCYRSAASGPGGRSWETRLPLRGHPCLIRVTRKP